MVERLPLDTLLPLLSKSALAGSYTVRRTNSNEQLRFANGSTISLLSSTMSAGHGVVSDFTVLNEAFSSMDSRLEMQALINDDTPLRVQTWARESGKTPDP